MGEKACSSLQGFRQRRHGVKAEQNIFAIPTTPGGRRDDLWLGRDTLLFLRNSRWGIYPLLNPDPSAKIPHALSIYSKHVILLVLVLERQIGALEKLAAEHGQDIWQSFDGGDFELVGELEVPQADVVFDKVLQLAEEFDAFRTPAAGD